MEVSDRFLCIKFCIPACNIEQKSAIWFKFNTISCIDTVAILIKKKLNSQLPCLAGVIHALYQCMVYLDLESYLWALGGPSDSGSFFLSPKEPLRIQGIRLDCYKCIMDKGLDEQLPSCFR